MLRTSQRRQGLADPPAVRPGQVASEDGFVDLRAATGVARKNLASELARRTVRLNQPTTWDAKETNPARRTISTACRTRARIRSRVSHRNWTRCSRSVIAFFMT